MYKQRRDSLFPLGNGGINTMKNFAKKFLTLTIAAAMFSGMTACGGVTGGPTESNDGPKESVNAEMVQLNVYNYDGGYEQST